MPHPARLLGPARFRPPSVRPGNTPLTYALRGRAEPPVAVSADPQARDPRLARLEAVLMITDEPLTARKLAEIAGLGDAAAASRMVEDLDGRYAVDGSAFRVVELAGGYQLLTRAVFHPWLTRLRRTGHDLRLTPTTMETLAVIAYRQPITRADIESVRGVSCVETIRQLMERGLVKNAGRHDSLGRPQLYGTTKNFLRAFGLNSLADLPEVESLTPPN